MVFLAGLVLVAIWRLRVYPFSIVGPVNCQTGPEGLAVKVTYPRYIAPNDEVT